MTHAPRSDRRDSMANLLFRWVVAGAHQRSEEVAGDETGDPSARDRHLLIEFAEVEPGRTRASITSLTHRETVRSGARCS